MRAPGYPKGVWLAPVVLAAVVWIPAMDWALYLGVALIAVAGPVFRHRALNPLGTADKLYFQWLKTTPYSPNMPLPNGTIYPNFRDLIFLGLLCLPLLPLLSVGNWMFIWGVILAITLALLSFCYIAARQLINLGPRWIGFAIIALSLVALRIDWFLTEQLSKGITPAQSILLQTLPPLLPFAVAVYGLHLIMQRYPWTGENLNPKGVYRGMSPQEIKYGYSDVTLTGQPYTFLNPKGFWPRVSWSDSLWMSLIPALVVPLHLGHQNSVILYGVTAAGALFPRTVLYYGMVFPSPFSGGLLISWRHGNLWKNAISAVLILAIVIVLFIMVLRNVPAPVAGPLAPVLTFLTFLAAFKLPPSRGEWETSGRWELSIDGPQQPKTSGTENALVREK